MEKELYAPLECLVVDDEAKAQQAIINLIDSLSWLRLSGCCFNVAEASEAIMKSPPDVIFLDVQMPGVSGLELIRSLPVPKPDIVLVTGHRDYAVTAFDYEVTDFLLKPIAPERFLKAVLKIGFKRRFDALPLKPPASHPYHLQEVTAGYGQENDPQPEGFTWLKSCGKFYKIPHRQIYSVEALKDYVKILYEEGILVVYGNLGAIETRLPKDHFVRIHRSCIINRHAVKSITGNMVHLENDKTYTIADRAKREAIIKLLTRE